MARSEDAQKAERDRLRGAAVSAKQGVGAATEMPVTKAQQVSLAAVRRRITPQAAIAGAATGLAMEKGKHPAAERLFARRLQAPLRRGLWGLSASLAFVPCDPEFSVTEPLTQSVPMSGVLRPFHDSREEPACCSKATGGFRVVSAGVVWTYLLHLRDDWESP